MTHYSFPVTADARGWFPFGPTVKGVRAGRSGPDVEVVVTNVVLGHVLGFPPCLPPHPLIREGEHPSTRQNFSRTVEVHFNPKDPASEVKDWIVVFPVYFD